MSKSRIRIERDAAVQKRSANSGTRTASTANGDTRAIPGNQVVSKASGREDPAEQTGVRRYDTASALSEDAAAKEVARAADRIGPYVPSPSPSGTRQVVIERTRVRYRDLSRSADKTAKHPRRAATLRNLEILARAEKGESVDALAAEYGLARQTVYVLVSRRIGLQRSQSGDGVDAFAKLER